MGGTIMKKTFYILAAFAACFAISCNKEITTEEPINEGETPEVEMQTITIKATIDDIVTKSYYAGGTTFNWNAGDEISVYCSDGSFYTFSADGTGTSTTFTGAIPAGKSLGAYAFFPADAGHTDGHFSLPRYKDLTSHNSADIPMVGVKRAGDVYSFVHCAGAALLTITNIPSDITSATITVESAHSSNPTHCIKLSGSFWLNDRETSAPYWSGAYAATDAEKQFSRKVTVSDHTAQVYVICPGGYNNSCPNKLTVVGHTSGGDVTLFNEKAMKKLGTVARAHVLPLTPLPADKLAFINWDDAGVDTFPNGTYDYRMPEWKATSDAYYVYFRLKIAAWKMPADPSGTYFYTGYNTNGTTGDGIAPEWATSLEIEPDIEALSLLYPFISNDGSTITFKEGEDSAGWIQCPVKTATGKLTTMGWQPGGLTNGEYIFVAFSVPRSKIGNPSGSITVQHKGLDGYLSSQGTFTLK
jgi:hypothetical protein